MSLHHNEKLAARLFAVVSACTRTAHRVSPGQSHCAVATIARNHRHTGA
jgi:hypothetical protein